jgi:hypothetical protein
MKLYTYQTLKLMTLLCLPLVIYGCGGSGSTPSANTTSVSGTVLAGPAAGAVVTVKANGVEVARSAPSAADGSYTVVIPNSELSKDLNFEAGGGTFPDEATSTTGVALGSLSAFAAGGTLTSGSNVTLDPSSTIMQKLVAGGRTKAAAETVFAAAFGYTPDCSVKPAFATISSASTTIQRLAGVRAAAFSQLTKDMGLTPAGQSELIQALADDLSDGVLDGFKTGGTEVTTASGTPIPADIGNRFASALMTFQTCPLNKSKLTTDRIGAPPFAKTALTDSYQVEYVPGMMAATQGKTAFKIKLSNRNDGSAAAGRSITLIPKMHMATMSHSAPVDSVAESAAPGTYDCSVYYQMASGPGMGIWELKVSIGGEIVVFYPSVAMSMGTTSRATLKGVTDMIGAAGTVKRTYNLFNDSSTFGMNSTFKLFIAASDDSMMMNFPTVSVNSTLTGLSVNTMTVEASTDNGATWNRLTDNGSGHWSVDGLAGLATGGTVKVRVAINGEQKTTDGNAAIAGTNDSATFTIVAGM